MPPFYVGKEKAVKRFAIDKFLKFAPLMMTFIEGGADAGGGAEESTTERALAFLNEEGDGPKPEEGGGAAAVAAPGAAAGAAAGDPDPAAVAAAAEALAKSGEGAAAAGQAAPAAAPAAAQPDPNAIDPKNWTAAAPVADFFKTNLGEWGVENDGKPITQERLKLVLEDARGLYEVAAGKADPKALLETFKANYPEPFKRMVERGMELAGIKAEGAGPKDPALERLEKLEEARETEKHEAAQREQMVVRQKAHDGFLDAVGKKLNENFPWLAQADQKFQGEVKHMYNLLTTSMVAGNREMVSRFEKGDFTDADRLFTQVHNGVISLLQGWAKALVAQKQGAVNNNPKIPARGAAPAPAASQKKFDPTSFESRTGAAMDYLNNPG